MSGITQDLSNYAASLQYEAIPDEVIERAKLLMIDLVGSVVRANAEAESTASVTGALALLGLDQRGTISVPGTELRLTPAIAALMTAMLGHSLDFDDTHSGASLHPSAPIVAAALSVGQATGAGGKDVLTAIIAGYEISCR